MHLIFLRIPLDSERGQSRRTRNIEEKGFGRQLMFPETRYLGYLIVFLPEKAQLKKQNASLHPAREGEKKPTVNERLDYLDSGLLK